MLSKTLLKSTFPVVEERVVVCNKTQVLLSVNPVTVAPVKSAVAPDAISSVTPDGTVYVSPESPIVADVPLAGDHLSAFISLLILI